ncbi:hypothetical protein [Nocardioides sp. W7]|uniref:hypothetical protein n=1 Tax=Nocardioides sp. W7 TaxID=2931390 RepID=UPI001FD1C907|nr:hypothetical protein [Nocardioides sp. W7]
MTSFDDQLAVSAPPAPVQTPALERELASVVAEAERQARHQKPHRRASLIVGGLAAAGLLGIGSAAAAGILPWFEDAPARDAVSTSTGSECELTFDVKGIEDPGNPVDSTTRAQALAAAEEFLSNLDLSSIDIVAATEGLPPRALVDSEAGPAQSIEEYETYAVMSVVEQRVEADLRRQGLPTAAVSVMMASSCGGE